MRTSYWSDQKYGAVSGAGAGTPHVPVLVLGLVAERQRVGVQVPPEEVLGQRRTVIGGAAFLSHDDDLAVGALCAQRADRAQACQRRSDDGDAPHAGSRREVSHMTQR
ncbi:hypothetical protein GCM10011579_035000 [Streptomyces albiflavescens]|uniref:Uncharacterized protein n=1 Tax=Streptomyces albiflavescens TaxID=1623582 RepID=A0A917Y327_9ACTN|nr:hypothetical protein GCM10011579_035000 [Streptomyces albiflavescens]